MAKKDKKPKGKKKNAKPGVPVIFQNTEIQHKFSDSEKAGILDELARRIREVESIESQAKSSAKSWKVKIEEANLRVNALTTKAQDGFEMRPVEARVEFDRKKGRKTFFDKTSGDVLKEEEMSAADYEMLPLDTPKPKEPAPGEGLVNVGDAIDTAGLNPNENPVPE